MQLPHRTRPVSVKAPYPVKDNETNAAAVVNPVKAQAGPTRWIVLRMASLTDAPVVTSLSRRLCTRCIEFVKLMTMVRTGMMLVTTVMLCPARPAAPSVQINAAVPEESTSAVMRTLRKTRNATSIEISDPPALKTI